MKPNSRTLFSLLAVSLICLAGAASATPVFMPISNIVKNGGFETGSLPPWSISRTGASAITHDPDKEIFGVDQDSAHSGNFGAFAGPSRSLAFLGQNLSTASGSSYDLSFWMDENQNGDFSASSRNPVDFQVFWNGSLIFETFTPPSSYTQFTFADLVATSSSTDLTFGFRDRFGTFHLDDVRASLSRVPEAFSTIWLALPLLLLLVFARPLRPELR